MTRKKSLALIGILLVITSFLVPISEKRLTENEWCDIPYTADLVWSVNWIFAPSGDFQQLSDLRVNISPSSDSIVLGKWISNGWYIFVSEQEDKNKPIIVTARPLGWSLLLLGYSDISTSSGKELFLLWQCG